MTGKSPSRSAVRFGPFELVFETKELYKNAKKVKLSGQAIEVLAALTATPGALVTREELRVRLWPGTNYGDFEHGLNAAVNRLRETLGDSASNPRYIETIPRQGYRFIGNTSDSLTTDRREEDQKIIQVVVPPKEDRGHRSVAVMVTSVCILVTAITVYFLWERQPRLRLQHMQIRKLTNDGLAFDVAISPDGHFVAYSSCDRERASLWLKHVKAGVGIQIFSTKGSCIWAPTFSPDGSHIYFVRTSQDSPESVLSIVPATGGNARDLIRNVDGAVSFSPDGGQIAFARGGIKLFAEIRTANADGTNERLIAKVPDVSIARLPDTTWSPDGRFLAGCFQSSSNRRSFTLDIVSIADGTVRPLLSLNQHMGRARWLPKGNGLIVELEGDDDRGQLFVVSYPGGKLQRLSNDLADYDESIDLSGDGQELVTIQRTKVAHVWSSKKNDYDIFQQLTFGEAGMRRVSPGPDGRLLAVSTDSRLWLMNNDGGQPTQLNEAQNVDSATWCGSHIIYTTFQNGPADIMRLDPDGTDLKRLATGPFFDPVCSPDKEFVYLIQTGTPHKIVRIPVDGGKPGDVAPMLGDVFCRPLIGTGDGKVLFYRFIQLQPKPTLKLASVTTQSHPEVHEMDFEGGCSLPIRGSPNNDGVQYVLTHDGVSNVWQQSFDGRIPRQLTSFRTDEIFDFNWTADGRQLFVARGKTSGDVVVLSNFQ